MLELIQNIYFFIIVFIKIIVFLSDFFKHSLYLYETKI